MVCLKIENESLIIINEVFYILCSKLFRYIVYNISFLTIVYYSPTSYIKFVTIETYNLKSSRYQNAAHCDRI